MVATGGVTTVDPHLQVGEQKDTVTVDTINPQIEVESHTIDQVITRQQIQQLPLNGRSFLQLAFLSPGIAISTNYQGDYNRAMDVSILGGDPDRTRIAVDGARINDSVDGGTQQNFSQEIVQEFQISSVNFDLSTGITAAGAINIVTRSGSNQFHGSAFFFFRDHHMAAYPGLQRDPLAPDPFFARRQSGLWVGGPVVKDRLFFFAAYEHNNQDGVFTSVPTDPAFSSLARVTASPKHDNLVNARLDYRISAANTAFVRFSHDGNNTFAPREVNSMPSAWESNTNWADSGVFSLISTLRPTLVNEFRYSNTFWSNHNAPPTADQCPGCLGLGGPHVTVEGAGVAFGNQTNSPQSRLVRRNIFADNMTWQHATHRMKFGGEIEFLKGTGTYTLDAPADITLFSPQEVRQLAPPLSALMPTTFNTLSDVLSLPLKTFVFGIGDVNQPPTFQRSQADHDRLFHVYWQDTWKVRPHFTFNYGLAWSFESNALNHDLTKPQYLAPIFGANGLGHEQHAYLRFSPAAGFAWSLPDNRTVIRGGGGIFYDTLNIETRLVERAYLGPLGTGYLPLPGSIVPNPIPVPGLPAGAPLDIRVPTALLRQPAHRHPPAGARQRHPAAQRQPQQYRSLRAQHRRFQDRQRSLRARFCPRPGAAPQPRRAAPGHQRFRRHRRFRLPPLHPRKAARRGSQPLHRGRRSRHPGLHRGASHRARRRRAPTAPYRPLSAAATAPIKVSWCAPTSASATTIRSPFPTPCKATRIFTDSTIWTRPSPT